MAQVTDWDIDGGLGGSAVRAQMNLIFAALASMNSGAAAPSPTFAGMPWLDTGVTPSVLRQRNSANTAWIALGPETVAAKTIRGNSGAGAAAIGDIDMATLATMLGFASSLADPGYVKLPGGLIIQWGGTGSVPAGGGTTVTFPIAFASAVYRVIISPATAANNTSVFSVGARNPTLTNFIATNNSGTSGPVLASWIAVGV